MSASWPTEPGLFGPQERPARPRPCRLAPGERQSVLWDGLDDLPGQRVLTDDETPEDWRRDWVARDAVRGALARRLGVRRCDREAFLAALLALVSGRTGFVAFPWGARLSVPARRRLLERLGASATAVKREARTRDVVWLCYASAARAASDLDRGERGKPNTDPLNFELVGLDKIAPRARWFR